MNQLSIYGIIGGAMLIVGIGLGWKYEHNRFVAFRVQVESTAKIQEAKIESIEKQQKLVTKGIEDEYNAKLTAIRNYYKSTSVYNNTSSDKVSSNGTTPSATDVIASYNLLAGQCAETTQQLVSLQDWIKDQIGIK